MIIDTPGLKALRTGFSDAYDIGAAGATNQHLKVATVVPSSTKEMRYGWLGKVPNVREWIGDRVVQNLMESDYTIRERPWELTIGVDRDDIETDNLGIYGPLFQTMGESTGAKWDQLVFELLLAGFSTNCYDGQYFFDVDHPVIGADGVLTSVANTDAVAGTGAPWFLLDVGRALKPLILQKRKDFKFVSKDKETDDNVFDRKEFVYGADARGNVGYGFWQFAWGSKQPLTAANYAAARAAMSSFKGDYGRPLNINPTLLVVPPSLESAALKIVNNELGANGETNEWKGTAQVEKIAWLA